MFNIIEIINKIYAFLTSYEKLELSVTRLNVIYKVIQCAYQYIKQYIGKHKFDIECKLFDYQSPYLAHYSVIVKDSSPVKKKHTVVCTLSSKLNLLGCKIKIIKWHVRTDFEHTDEISIQLNNEDPNNIIFCFELPYNQKYRMIIESDVEYIGVLSGPYDLTIA